MKKGLCLLVTSLVMLFATLVFTPIASAHSARAHDCDPTIASCVPNCDPTIASCVPTNSRPCFATDSFGHLVEVPCPTPGQNHHHHFCQSGEDPAFTNCIPPPNFNQSGEDDTSAKTTPGHNGNPVLLIECGLDFFTGGFVGEIIKGFGKTLKIVKVIKVLDLTNKTVTDANHVLTVIAVVKFVKSGKIKDALIEVGVDLVPFGSCFQIIGPRTLKALREVINPPLAS